MKVNLSLLDFKRFILFLCACAMLLTLGCGIKELPPVTNAPTQDGGGSPSNTVINDAAQTSEQQPSPTASFSLSKYAVNANGGIYDIYPLVEKKGWVLCYSGFILNSNNIVLLHVIADGSAYSVSTLNISNGIMERHFEGTLLSGTSSSTPEAFLVFNVEPFSFVDKNGKELHIVHDGYSSSYTVNISNYDFETFYTFDNKVYTFDLKSDTLFSIDPTANADSQFVAELSFDYRYRFVRFVSLTNDGSYAAFICENAFSGQTMTIAVDMNTHEILGAYSGFSYLSNDNSGKIVSLSYDSVWNDIESSSSVAVDTFSDFTERNVINRNFNYDNTYIRDITILHDTYQFAFITENDGYRLHLASMDGSESLSINLNLDILSAATFAPKLRDHCCSSNGYVVLTIQSWSATNSLVLWDSNHTFFLEYPIVNTTSIDMPYTAIKQNSIDYGDLSDYAALLEERYGISVLFAENATILLPHYNTKVNMSLEGIQDVLAQLYNALSKYPANFLHALCQDSLNGIVFEFVNEINTVIMGNTSYPTAITCIVDEYRYFIFSSKHPMSIEETVHHELSHMIDDALDRLALDDDKVWSIDGWNALNPDGFMYFNSYTDAEGQLYSNTASDEFTPANEAYSDLGEVQNIYFLDRYSKTFAKEDRALLMQTMLSDEPLPHYMSSPHIIAKLQYYFSAIRALIDPKGLWSNPTFWETSLEGIISDADTSNTT